jgi:hypothetical protein
MYLDLLNEQARYLWKYIWKLKIPLKIKICMWFLNKKVILTKDNPRKRNWQGNSKCCFCDKEETIQHLFFDFSLAKIIWRTIHMSFGISPPTNVTNLFGNWLYGLDKKKIKSQIRVGICALLCAIWHVRNDFIFNKSKCVWPWVGSNIVVYAMPTKHFCDKASY